MGLTRFGQLEWFLSCPTNQMTHDIPSLEFKLRSGEIVEKDVNFRVIIAS